uniref:Uncharacterized protein n=1 Tax=Ditylenchus dipsaci TaxID=166011 RepID=A0A915EJX7_9BILA
MNPRHRGLCPISYSFLQTVLLAILLFSSALLTASYPTKRQVEDDNGGSSNLMTYLKPGNENWNRIVAAKNPYEKRPPPLSSANQEEEEPEEQKWIKSMGLSFDTDYTK